MKYNTKFALMFAFVLALAVLMHGVYADDTTPRYIIKTNSQLDLKDACLINNQSYCGRTSTCSFSLTNTNQTALIINQNMDNISYPYWNYTISTQYTQQPGIYESLVSCTDSNTNISAYDDFFIQINTLGSNATTSQGIIYVVVLIIAIIFFFVCLIAGIYTPGDNSKDMAGYVVSVSNIKYVKLLLLAFSYIILMLIAYFAWNVSLAYLDLGFLSGIFQTTFYTLAIATVPLFILCMYFLIANLVQDSRISDTLSRGLKYRD